MMFTALRLASAFLIEPELLEDDRGFFARTWCAREFTAHGLNPALVQCNISFNRRKGTLRGMHFQAAPHEEARLVQCSMGSMYDVIIDLRPESATYKQHLAVVLSAENHLMLYVPEGFAHGFQTLERSEEHTSELQSRLHLVCRLLLEKKKKTQCINLYTINTMQQHVLI